MDNQSYVLENENIRLTFTEEGCLTGLIDIASGRNYIITDPHVRLPMCRITFTELLSGIVQPGEFRLSTFLASEIHIERTSDSITFCYNRIEGQEISVICRIRLPKASMLSFWSIEIHNNTEFAIKSVEYPMVATQTVLSEPMEDNRILLPKLDGYLLPSPLYMDWEGDEPYRVYNQRFLYPGDGRENPNGASTQLLAFYDRLGGMYLATYDGTGAIKEFGPIWIHDEKSESYLDFSPVHHIPEASGNDFKCTYETVLGCFKGDWQDAALIYKKWAITQPWCSKRIAERTDIPDWVKEGAFFFNIRLRFQEDKEEFLYRVPDYIQSWRDKLKIPMVAMMCGWEKLGEWTGPDYFPPYGGEERFAGMCHELRKQNIRIFPFGLSGLKLPIRKKISKDFDQPNLEIDYDNRIYFHEHFEKQACMYPGNILITDSDVESWDGLHGYACVTSEQAREQLYGATMKLIDDYQIDISQADQVLNGAAVECYNPHHGHPLGRGRWQIEALQRIYADIRRDGKAKRNEFVLSEEWISEPFIQYLDLYHGRNYDEPRGLEGVPLISFLYHEFIPCYGGDWTSFLSENTSGVYFHGHNFVYGNLPAGCPLTMRYMTRNADVEEADPDILEMASNACELFQKFSRYLVMGEMLPNIHLNVPNIDVQFFGMQFSGWKKRSLKKPSVLHCMWKDEEGQIACALANISAQEQTFTVDLSAFTNAHDYRFTGNHDSCRTVKRGERIALKAREVAIIEL